MQLRLAMGLWAALAFGCGKKAEKSPPEPGSADGSSNVVPSGSATGSAAGSAGSAAGSATDSAAGSAAGSATGSATAAGSGAGSASAALDLCKLTKLKPVEDAIGPVFSSEATPNPVNLPPGAEGILGCKYVLANREVTVEAKPVAEFDDKPAKYKEVVKGLGEKAFVLEGTVTVKLPGKSWMLRVNANAGERNPDDKMAVRLAKVLVPAIK